MSARKQPAQQGYPDFRFVQFCRDIEAMYAEMRAQHRSHLSYDEWNLWAQAAVSNGIVAWEEVGVLPIPRNAAGWRRCVLVTLANVAESQRIGRTAREHYRAGLDAIEQEQEQRQEHDREERDRQAARIAANAAPRGTAPKKLHAGAAGSL